MDKERIKEYRDFTVQELRADSDDGAIEGYAAVFDQPAELWPGLDEVVRKGAFRKTINDGADVFAFWNHESGTILGRTKNNTLELLEDDHGLRVKISPPDTPRAQEARDLIRQGFVDKMSFGFQVIKEEWTDSEDGNELRELKEVRLFEVSPVPIPAYEGTAVSARSARPERPEKEDKTESEERNAPDEGVADTEESEEQGRDLESRAEPEEGLHSLDSMAWRLRSLNIQTKTEE